MSTLSVQNIQGVSNLSISGGIAFANGTNVIPAIASASSPNTGIFFPTANTIAFTEGGVEAMRLDANSNMTVVGTVAMGSSFMRNKIINGDMRIDQRYAGTSFTPTTDGLYHIDRWRLGISQASKLSAQRNAGSVTPPSGFTNYEGITSLSAYNLLAADAFLLGQFIEGFNTSDLDFGTVNAKPITVSFWVRGSITGLYTFAIRNSAYNRSYIATYTINQANTWEYKTVTIPGDTTGTWLTDTNAGIRIDFNLGSGSNAQGTAGTWAGTASLTVAGAVSVVSTNAATWYITGVQLEAGTVATPFERRHYGQELALCQRYYEVGGRNGWIGYSSGAGNPVIGWVGYRVTKRAAATITIPSYATQSVNSASPYSNTTDGFEINGTTSATASAAYIVTTQWSASSEL